jgi:hypothetical protein
VIAVVTQTTADHRRNTNHRGGGELAVRNAAFSGCWQQPQEGANRREGRGAAEGVARAKSEAETPCIRLPSLVASVIYDVISAYFLIELGLHVHTRCPDRNATRWSALEMVGHVGRGMFAAP